MRFSYSNLLKSIALYGSGDLLVKASVFITIPIYTRIFAPQDYGVLSYIFASVGLFSVFLSLGAESVFTRFYWEAKTAKERKIFASTWFSFLSLWSVGIVLFCLPFRGFFLQWSFGTSKYATMLALAILTVPVSLLNSLCGQVLRNQERPGLFSVLNFFSTLLNVGVSLYAVVILRLGLLGIFAGGLIAACIMLPVRLWTARHLLAPVFSKHVLGNMLAFGVPLVPMSMAYWIFGLSDRMILGKLSSLDQVGLYAIAYSLSSILFLINSAVGLAWAPLAMQMYEKDRENAPVIIGQFMTYLLVVFGLLSVVITTFALEAIMLLTTPAFYPAASAVGPLTLGFSALATTQVTALGISLTKKTKFFPVLAWSAALINLCLNILFIPRWGMLAASWTTAISYSFLSVSYMLKSQSLWPVLYERQRALIATGLTFVFVVGVTLLPEMSAIARTTLKILYVMTYVGLLVRFQVLDKREWRAFSSILRDKLALA